MAYSDYGAYVFRNGKRISERSDTPLPELAMRSTPAGFYHGVLGDGPIFVGLYKQIDLSVFRGADRIELLDIISPNHRPLICPDGKWLDRDRYLQARKPCRLKIDKHKITVYWLYEENYYQFVKLEQPDRVTWHGWSGYGVGAGLESGRHGYITEKQNERLLKFYPGAILEN